MTYKPPLIGRRSFLLAGAAAAALAGFTFTAESAEARIVDLGFPKRTLAGYCWPWTARPGESIAFKVSAYAPGDYRADLVRLICADGHTDGGSHYKEEVIKAPFAKNWPGRTQKSHLGSFVEIADTHALDKDQSFTLTTSVFPTTVRGGTNLSAASFNPLGEGPGKRRVQHMICRWDEATQTGWSLAIDEQDRPAFYVGNGPGSIDKVALHHELVLRRWVRITVRYDATTKNVTLALDPVIQGPGDRTPRTADRAEGVVRTPPQQGVLRFGAAIGGPSNGPIRAVANPFNGKLDTVRLMAGVLDDAAVRKLWTAVDPAEQSAAALGWWDFIKGAGSTTVHDLSGNGLQGKTVNLPERAVIGVNWDKRTFEWKTAPHQYSAIYFHEDALSDADWKTDFEFKVPAGLRSGFYAARLRQGASETYIPFFVAPAKTAPKAKIALIAPTLTHLGYLNALGATYWTRKVQLAQPDGSTKVGEEEWMPIYTEEKTAVELLNSHGPEYGMGLYRFYLDGAPVRQAPMRVPNMASIPKVLNKNVVADTDIIEWLEHEGVAYDVITDELLHAEGIGLLDGYTTVLTGSHTEYVTWEMFDAYMAYLDKGGRLMSLGGNGFHTRVAFHPEVPGVVECRKQMGGTPAGLDYHFETFGEFDGKANGRFKEIGAPANILHGLGTTSLHPLTAGTHYRRQPGADDPRAAFIFKNVPDQILGDFGKSGGGAVSEEMDHADLKEGTPPHTLILATSENMVWPMVSEDGLTDPKYQLNFDPRCDMVFFETPNGGAVFSVGSMGYRASLSHNGFDNNIARITHNVLTRFADATPFRYPA
jgi:N,N-dimethylformamidase